MLTLLSTLTTGQNRHRLLVLQNTGPLASEIPNGISVINLRSDRLRYAPLALFREFRRLRPRAIISTMGYLNLMVLVVARIASPSSRIIVREANDPAATMAAIQPSWLIHLAYSFFYPWASAILCPTRAIATDLARAFGIPIDRLILFPNPVNESRLRRIAARTRRHPGPGARFVMAGRLTRQKGWDRLLEMFVSVDADAHLTILGDGEDRPLVQEAIKALGLSDRVTLAGYVAEPWGYFSGADALLLTSRWEGMPNVALEALAVGVPVIATPEGGGIIEIAEEAAPGAITIVSAGDSFIAAMKKVRIRTGEFSPSLLPARFTMQAAQQQFLRILGAS